MVLLAGLLTSPSLAAADEVTTATAEAAFREGAKLFDDGAYAEACPKLEGAVKLAGETAIGGKLLLAQCFHKLGRIASAWGLYAEVAAKSSDNPERRTTAQAGQDELFPLLHYVVIRTSPKNRNLQGFSVQRNQSALPIDLLETRLPVDPGVNQFRAEAAGFEALEVSIDVPNAAGETPIELAELVPTPPPIVKDAPEDGGFWSPGKVAGVVIGVAGLGVIGAGVGVGALASAQYDAALVEGECAGESPPTCRDVSPVEDALGVADIGTGLVIAGGGLAVGGVLLVVLAPSGDEPQSRVSVSFGPTGGWLRGSF